MQFTKPLTATALALGLTFGGGMAMLPILQREVVENKGWATDEELTDYFAIGQCTPGVIAVNTATFIGQKRAGIAGGIVATLGVVFPSLLIIVALAGVITSFSHLTGNRLWRPVVAKLYIFPYRPFDFGSGIWLWHFLVKRSIWCQS